MQDCFRKYPDVYGSELDDDEEDDEEFDTDLHGIEGGSIARQTNERGSPKPASSDGKSEASSVGSKAPALNPSEATSSKPTDEKEEATPST
jgi:intermembrane space import and assembly protein 40